MARSSKAHIIANARYDKKTYDKIPFAVRRDAEINGEFIRSHAALMGESINGFFTRAVIEAMERDKQHLSE